MHLVRYICISMYIFHSTVFKAIYLYQNTYIFSQHSIGSHLYIYVHIYTAQHSKPYFYICCRGCPYLHSTVFKAIIWNSWCAAISCRGSCSLTLCHAGGRGTRNRLAGWQIWDPCPIPPPQILATGGASWERSINPILNGHQRMRSALSET